MKHVLCCCLLLTSQALAALPEWDAFRTNHKIRVVLRQGLNGDDITRSINLMSLTYKQPEDGPPLTIVVASQDIYGYFASSKKRLSFFVPSNTGHYIVLGPEAKSQELMHELSHYFVRARFGPTLPWFDEGLAVALSTVHRGPSGYLLGGRTRYEEGSDCHYAVPLDIVLAAESFEQGPYSPKASYQTAGILLKALISRFGLDNVLHTLEPLASRPVTLEALASAFQVSIPELRNPQKRTCDISIPLPIEEPQAPAYAERSQRIQVLDILAELAVRMPSEVAQGELYYKHVLKASPDDPTALEGLGIAATVRGDYRQAVALFVRINLFKKQPLNPYAAIACRSLDTCSLSLVAKPDERLTVQPEDDDSSTLTEISPQWSCKRNCSPK